MTKRKHLIIGSGSAALSALEQIRRLNSQDAIKVVTVEDSLPYSPTILPYVLSGKIKEEHVSMKDENYFKQMKATFVRNRKVVSVLPDAKQIVYQDGEKEHYDNLLIASGSEATKPQIKGLDENTFFGFHTKSDCRRLLLQLTDKNDVTVLGAGLVGMEIATSLVERGCRVIIVEKEPRLLPLYLDQEAEPMIRNIFLTRGVRFLTGREISEVNRMKGKVEICLCQGETFISDLLVTCVGVTARTHFVAGTGITVNRGILVNRRMKTDMENIYAAGDVAETADFFTGKAGMNPTIPSAVEQGEVAGSNMIGVETEYEGWISTNIFNFFGNTVFSVGATIPDGENYQIFNERNEQKTQLKRLVFNGDRLVGATFINIDLDPGIILYLIRNRIEIGSHIQQLFEQPKEIIRWLMQETEHAGATKH